VTQPTKTNRLPIPLPGTGWRHVAFIALIACPEWLVLNLLLVAFLGWTTSDVVLIAACPPLFVAALVYRSRTGGVWGGVR
jgi:hypothetical protein